MSKKLIIIGAVLIPFVEIWVRIIPYVYPDVPDTRVLKEILVLYFAMAIFLSVLWQGGIQKVANKWLLVLVGYSLFAYSFWWKMSLVVNDIQTLSFWMWKPLYQGMIIFLMAVSVSSIKFEKKDIVQLMNIMCYAGLIMGLYVGFQALGIDSFYRVKDFKLIGHLVMNPNMVGNLGQPTLVAPYLAITALVAIYLRKWLVAVYLITIVALINGQMAIGAMVLSVSVYAVMVKPKIIVFVLIGALFVGYHFYKRPLTVDALNGRTTAWGMIIDDWKGKPLGEDEPDNYSMFGVGLGSFGYVFHEKNQINFHTAHCEPLEVLISMGFIGLILYILAILEHLRLGFLDYMRMIDWRKRFMALLLSIFILLQLNSLGTFIFQLGIYQYITALIVGLIINKTIFGGENEKINFN